MRDSQLRSRQQSSVRESNGSTSTVAVQRPSLSLAYHVHLLDSLAAALLEKNNSDDARSLKGEKATEGTNSYTFGIGQDLSPSRARTRVTTSTGTRRTIAVGQTNKASYLNGQSAPDLSGHHSPESVSLLGLTSLSAVPRSPVLATQIQARNSMCLATISPKRSANERETSNTSFLASALHRDDLRITEHSERPSSQASSTASATWGHKGKSSWPPDSSYLRLKTCQICKKSSTIATRRKSAGPYSQVAPSVVDRVSCCSADRALPESAGDNLFYVKNSGGNPPIFSLSVDGSNEPAEECHPPLWAVARPAPKSLPESASAMSSATINLSPSGNLTLNTSGKLPDGFLLPTAEEAQGHEEPGWSNGSNLPETPYDLGSSNILYDSSREGPAKMPQTTSVSTSTAANRSSCENEQTSKKLCARCHKYLLGSTSTCIQCRSEENRSKIHPCTPCSPTTPMAVSVEKTFPSLLNEALSADQSHLPHNVISAAPKGIPRSPFVPETPDLVLDNKSNGLEVAPVDQATARISQKPLVPRRRPAVCSTVIDNEHCFSKKKPRIFRPVKEAITVRVPPLKPKKHPFTPTSCSPRIGDKLRDTDLQRVVEIDDRGRPPCSMHGEVADRLNVAANASNQPSTRSSPVTPHRHEVAAVDDVLQVSAPFSQHSTGKSKQLRMNQRCSKPLEQQAKGFPQSGQDCEQAEVAVARFQKTAQSSERCLRQKSPFADDTSCDPAFQGEVDRHPSADVYCRADSEACKWTPNDGKMMLRRLQNRGVMFEEGCSSDSDIDMPLPRTEPVPKDPLWRRPRSSTDLFLIAPRLNINHSSFDVEQKRKEIAGRPPRKQRRRNLSYLRQERGQEIHEEVKRTFAPRTIKVSSTDISEYMDLTDDNTHRTATERAPEAETTFCDFIGAPARPMAILTKDKQLAFRDGTRDIRGGLPRAREKFIVTTRSVACMEH